MAVLRLRARSGEGFNNVRSIYAPANVGVVLEWPLLMMRTVLFLFRASVPFNPPAKEYIPPSEVSARAPLLGYMEYFASEESTKEIESRLFKFFNLVFRRPPATETTPSVSAGASASAPTSDNEDTWPLRDHLRRLLLGPQSPRHSDLLDLVEAEVYLRSFSPTWEEKGSGMQGPLSYYRTGQLRVAEEKGMNAQRSRVTAS